MNAYVGGERVVVTDRDLLGAGGEGNVYLWRERALKLYHDANGPAARLALAKVRAFPPRLPRAVVAPVEIAHDGRGRALGFTMPIVQNATEAVRLGQRKWRDGRLGNASVAAIFKDIAATLRALHARGVIVGDLNDGNVLFANDLGATWLIDADSMQLGGLPCPVAHERFLDPRLYGVDLTAAPRFDEASDWYAFGVMLFASLLYVHPYGGAHARIPTLLRRAEARHSVLRSDVVYPKSAAPIAILPDEWIDWARAVFDDGARPAFPESLLDARWTRCACGVEHAKNSCPACAAPRALAPSNAAEGCRVAVVRRTPGRVVHAVFDGAIRYLVEEDGAVRREDGSVVLGERAPANARFAIAGAATWVGIAGRLVRVVGGAEAEHLSTATFDASPAFDANARACVVVLGDWLVDAARGDRIGQVIENQTWVRIGDALGFGFYRAGALLEHFVFRPDRGGGFFRVALPAAGGRLLDAAAWFDGDRALFARAVDRGGRRAVDLFVVSSSGRVVASASGAADDHPMFAALGARCLAHGAMLCATDDGLLLVRVDDARRELVPDRLFSETRGLVSTATDLVPGPGGSVFAIGPNEITHLTPR